MEFCSISTTKPTMNDSKALGQACLPNMQHRADTSQLRYMMSRLVGRC
jgi:hypothetical protein